MQNKTQSIINTEKRPCAKTTCFKPIEVGEKAIKRYRKGLTPQYYHLECWRK
jgi:hypothetical protein